ncbi:MAG TPA: WYL domain-containing protein [Bacteroidia bacterium]
MVLLCLKAEINQVRTYGLDRIVSIDIKKKKFTIAKELDLKNYFKHCFGIITPTEGKPERVVFSFTNEQANYIKNYPLHESQKVIKETTKQTQFEITVFITYDLIMELQSYGKEITIQSPKNLIKLRSS